MRTFFFVAMSFVLLTLPMVAIGAPSVDELKENVARLWQPLHKKQPQVTAQELKKIIDAGEKIYLVDIRGEAEYQAGHLPNAIHLKRGVLEWRAPEQLTDTKRPIYLYCRTSARGAFAIERLSEIGYPNVFNVSDAFKGWVESGFPIYNRHGEFVLTKGGFEKKEN